MSGNFSGSQRMSKRPHPSEPVGSWISWFTGLQGHDFLCRVPSEYITDRFNLTGLEDTVPNINLTLDIILDTEFASEPWEKTVKTVHAENLYARIHARYILTAHGVEAMCRKYEMGDFGNCPRVYCRGQNTLPVGMSDEIGHSHVKLYCPSCHDIFQPRSRCGLLDGAMFGTSFPHMFFMQLPDLRPQPPLEKYVGRLYGFKLHQSALVPADSPESPMKSGFELTKPSSAASMEIMPSTRTRRMSRFHF